MAAAIGTITSLAASLLGSLDDKKTAKAEKSAQDFESVFLTQMLNSMSEGIGKDTGFDGGDAETQWRSMLNEYTGRAIAAGGGVGLSDGVLSELLKTQGA